MTPQVPTSATERLLVVWAAIALSLAGCSSSSHGTSTVAPVTDPPGPLAEEPAPPEPATHGYFIGSVRDVYAGEALLTVEGLARIFIDGVPGAPDSLESRQFVGHVEFTDGEAYGTGLVYAEGCTDGTASTVCGSPVPAELTITTATRAELIGEIVLPGGEAWPFYMGWPTLTYLEPATGELASGQYTETHAEFALDAVINVDSDGRFFFQSPQSGCVGNGSLMPHADGAFNAYDVALVVANCAAGFEASNGEFEGLATRSMDGPWGYWADWLLMWVSSVATEPVPQAFVMWGSRIIE